MKAYARTAPAVNHDHLTDPEYHAAVRVRRLLADAATELDLCGRHFAPAGRAVLSVLLYIARVIDRRASDRQLAETQAAAALDRARVA